MERASIIRPGLLVAVKSTVAGGVQYARKEIETGREVSTWETTRTMEDPDEHNRAVRVRGACLSLIRGRCILTSFGLLCPQAEEYTLDAAIDAARRLEDEFNSTARHTRVEVRVLRGRIASTDEQAAQAISSEIRGLVSAMEEGVSKLDPAAIRDAASRAKRAAAMLSPDRAAIVSEAVKSARDAAKAIVKRAEEGLPATLAALETVDQSAIATARVAFLDLDDSPSTDTAEAMPAASVQRFADLDLDTAEGA